MVTLNLKLTDEQVIELVRQLPSERKSRVLAALRDESAVRKARAGNLRRLFCETQSLPQARAHHGR